MSSFPRRPDHDDFWLMAAIIQDLDAAADDGVALERIAGDIDLDSLLYMAEQRALRGAQAALGGRRDADLETWLAGAWVDAFKAGMEFQKRRSATGR